MANDAKGQPDQPESGDPPAPIEPIPLDEDSSAPPTPLLPRQTLKPSLSAEPLIKLADDLPCPKCCAKMAPDQVVCMKCGYDITAGRVQQTSVGPAVEVEPPPEIPEFSKPGKLDSLALTIIGALLLAAAMFAAGYFGPATATSSNRAAAVGLTALEAFIHTGTGLIAVAVAAFLTKQRFGRVDLAAARIFLAVCAFLLVTKLRYQPPEDGQVIASLIIFAQWVAAMALYWFLIMVLFWKKPNEAGLLAGAHLTLYLGLSVLVWVQSWLHSVANAVAPAGTTP